MGWIRRFLAGGVAAPADPWDEPLINGAPNDADKVIRTGAETPATPVERPDPQIAEEIKRRQIAVAVRYVAAVRAPFSPISLPSHNGPRLTPPS